MSAHCLWMKSGASGRAVELNQASDQTSAPRKSLKDTEQQLKDVNEQIEKVKDL